MPGPAPKLIAIDHDDYHAEFVGKTADGRQFFLTTPFVPRRDDNPGCEFLALYIFDSRGKLIEAKIENLGPRKELDHEGRIDLRDEWIKALGPLSFERIEIAPFSVDRFGVTFGLIPEGPSDEREDWIATLEPGNYMAFFAPWDSGIYDT